MWQSWLGKEKKYSEKAGKKKKLLDVYRSLDAWDWKGKINVPKAPGLDDKGC